MAGIVDLLGPDAFRETVADAMTIVESTRASEVSSLVDAPSTSISWIIQSSSKQSEEKKVVFFWVMYEEFRKSEQDFTSRHS